LVPGCLTCSPNGVPSQKAALRRKPLPSNMSTSNRPSLGTALVVIPNLPPYYRQFPATTKFASCLFSPISTCRSGEGFRRKALTPVHTNAARRNRFFKPTASSFMVSASIPTPAMRTKYRESPVSGCRAAFVWAGVKAFLRNPSPLLQVEIGEKRHEANLVVAGNCRYYGGR